MNELKLAVSCEKGGRRWEDQRGRRIVALGDRRRRRSAISKWRRCSLVREQELVMVKPQKRYDRSQEREQSQAQAVLEAQLQGQGQVQLGVPALTAESGRKLTCHHHAL